MPRSVGVPFRVVLIAHAFGIPAMIWLAR